MPTERNGNTLPRCSSNENSEEKNVTWYLHHQRMLASHSNCMDNNHNNADAVAFHRHVWQFAFVYARTAIASPFATEDDDGFVARFVSFHFIFLFDPTTNKKNHMVHTQSKLKFSFRPVRNSRGNLPTASLTQMHIFAYITKLHHNPFTDSSKFWKISSGNAHSVHKMLLFSLLRQCHCQCNNIRFNIRSKACMQTWQ